LAVTDYSGSKLDILLGRGDGTFVSAQDISIGQQPTSVRSADFNNDGKPDLVVTIGGHPIPPITLQNYVMVFLNTPLLFSKTALTFPGTAVGSSSAATMIGMKNIGTVPITLTGFSLTGTNPGDFTEAYTCKSPLAASATCKIFVTFTPTATGLRTANLSVSDSALASPQAITLQGTGK
jgi:hypothetical protein